jgi:hypothetical protein
VLVIGDFAMPRQELNFVRFSSIATIDDIEEAGSSGDLASTFFAIHQRNVTAIYSGCIHVKQLCIITILNREYHIYAALNNLL